MDDVEARLPLRTEGIRVSTHYEAAELLRRVGDSLLFGLDISLGLSLGLARGRDVDVRSLVIPEQQTTPADEPPLPQVRYEYENRTSRRGTLVMDELVPGLADRLFELVVAHAQDGRGYFLQILEASERPVPRYHSSSEDSAAF